jgi:signal transduction histidine kinase
MQERIELIGGSLEIDSRKGRGTEIRARVPVSPELSPSAARADARS